VTIDLSKRELPYATAPTESRKAKPPKSVSIKTAADKDAPMEAKPKGGNGSALHERTVERVAGE